MSINCLYIIILIYKITSASSKLVVEETRVIFDYVYFSKCEMSC